MKIRMLAKFLGFLLFQPYYGTETTSQVVVAEALKIRNRVRKLSYKFMTKMKYFFIVVSSIANVPLAVSLEPFPVHCDCSFPKLKTKDLILRKILK